MSDNDNYFKQFKDVKPPSLGDQLFSKKEQPPSVEPKSPPSPTIGERLHDFIEKWGKTIGAVTAVIATAAVVLALFI